MTTVDTLEFTKRSDDCLDKSPALDNSTISVIIRFHNPAMLGFLEEALFSLALQSWENVEPVVVLQNGSAELRAAVERIILRQPWVKAPRYQVLCVPVAKGIDGRSHLMNCGISSARGRYLSFLDYDDVVYQDAYGILIAQLMKSNCVIAMGQCRRSRLAPASDYWYVETKDRFFSDKGSNRVDLFHDNFVPIHSYVIDRVPLQGFPLYFDETFSRGEDYEFLLRVCARFEADMSQLQTPVCEYRIRTDGSNTAPYWNDEPSKAELLLWEEHSARTEAKKDQHIVAFPMRELIRMSEKVSQLTEYSTDLANTVAQLRPVLEQNADLSRALAALGFELEMIQREHR